MAVVVRPHVDPRILTSNTGTAHVGWGGAEVRGVLVEGKKSGGDEDEEDMEGRRGERGGRAWYRIRLTMPYAFIRFHSHGRVGRVGGGRRSNKGPVRSSTRPYARSSVLTRCSRASEASGTSSSGRPRRAASSRDAQGRFGRAP